MVEIRKGITLSLGDLGEALTRCFEGHIIPTTYSPELLAYLLRHDNIDLMESLVASEDGVVVGILIIDRRGRKSRVGAMAIDVGHRRQGLGRAMMEQALAYARARGDLKVVLEVIEQNDAAVSFYKSLGFEVQHRLIAARVPLPDGNVSLREAEFAEMSRALMGRGDGAATWEMSAEAVAQYASPVRALAFEDMYVAVQALGEQMLLARSMVCAGHEDEPKLRGLLDGLGLEFPGRTLRIPVYFPEPEFSGLFVGAGFEIDSLSQFQMEMRF